MTASLTKKVRDLEAAFWSQAEYIETGGVEALDILDTFHPLGIPISNLWFANDTEAQKIARRIDHIEKTLPPIHPAFLRDVAEPLRLMQWGIHKRADYRRLLEDCWKRLREHIQAYSDLFKESGLIGVSLRLFEKDIDFYVAEREYMGLEWNREEMASDMIDLWRIARRECEKAGEPKDEKAHSEIWNRAFIEHVRDCYGREVTEEELGFDRKMWTQLREDMESGKPASESEAARYLRDLFERYPRKG